MKKGNKDCPEDWAVAAFIMKELAPSCSKEVSSHISGCGHCMDRAAVYYKAGLNEAYSLKAPKGWMEKAVETIQGDSPVREKASVMKRRYSYVQDMIESLPPLTGYAVATVAVALLIWVVFSDKPEVVTIASSQKLVIKDTGAPSSFGFMGRDEVEIKDDMDISISGNNIAFRWKEIKGAGSYSFSIMDKTTEKAVIAELALKEPYTSVPTGKLKKKGLYRWVITGNTQDEKSFEYTGEFVFAR